MYKLGFVLGRLILLVVIFFACRHAMQAMMADLRMEAEKSISSSSEIQDTKE